MHLRNVVERCVHLLHMRRHGLLRNGPMHVPLPVLLPEHRLRMHRLLERHAYLQVRLLNSAVSVRTKRSLGHNGQGVFVALVDLRCMKYPRPRDRRRIQVLYSAAAIEAFAANLGLGNSAAPCSASRKPYGGSPPAGNV